MVGFIIGTNGCHTKHLLDKYDVTMKVKSTDSRFRDLKRDETVCVFILQFFIYLKILFFLCLSIVFDRKTT